MIVAGERNWLEYEREVGYRRRERFVRVEEREVCESRGERG